MSRAPETNAPLSAGDFPIAGKAIYHLALEPHELAKDILIVGDPDRVPIIGAEIFASIEVDRQHRGLRTMTGMIHGSGQRVSVVTSGMGTPSLEIVLQELTALNEIDFERRRPHSEFEPLHIIRVGTSGALQGDTQLGVAVLSDFAVGLDNTGLFYEVSASDPRCGELEVVIAAALRAAAPEARRFAGSIAPYAARSDGEILRALENTARSLGYPFEVGTTISNGGFYANQGRDITRIKPTIPDIDRVLAAVQPPPGVGRLLNMEMETSFLFHFASGLGYRAGCVCSAIANRVENTFDTSPKESVARAAEIALGALVELRR